MVFADMVSGAKLRQFLSINLEFQALVPGARVANIYINPFTFTQE